MILNYTWPLFTGLFSILLFKVQKFDKASILVLILGFIGIVILGTGGSINNLVFLESKKGLILGLLAGVSYGLFSAYSSTLKDSNESALLLLFGTFLGAIGLTALSFSRYGWDMFSISRLDLLVGLIDGLILDALGYIVWTKALSISKKKNIDITSSRSLINFLPLISIILIGIFFNDEREVILQPYYLISFILILIACLIPNLKKKRKKLLDS